MTHLSNLVQFLDQTLGTEGFDDSCQNGLQVEASAQEVVKIGLAVDSGLSVFEQAVASKCQLLIVHHGLFWGSPTNISGLMGRKVRTLIEGGCSLYASHLPLDAHPEFGNNAEIIRLLGAKLGQSFFKSGQHGIGFIGVLPEAIKVEKFEHKVKELTNESRFLGLKFGTSEVKTVAVISGGAASAISEAKSLAVDAFITGEPKQNIFHEVKELQMNAFFAGHYQTEVFGVQAVGRLLQMKYGVETEFLDQPTGI